MCMHVCTCVRACVWLAIPRDLSVSPSYFITVMRPLLVFNVGSEDLK